MKAEQRSYEITKRRLIYQTATIIETASSLEEAVFQANQADPNEWDWTDSGDIAENEIIEAKEA
jgi:hypothetical protein